MTFKHDNFSSSEVMRSLERLVIQQGNVKPEQFVKQAAIKTCDISPTGNLMENVIKLCAGLRDQGLTKQAQELEANFLTYKQAQTLYQAHKETGEDLIESAHPEGSHKLRDVDSDEATFEDILEQHVKSLQMVNKTPKGKLSSAALISKVKTALGQEKQSSINDLISQANDDLQKVIRLITQSGGITGAVLNWAKNRFAITGELVGVDLQSLSLDRINDAMNAISNVSRNLHPNLLHNYFPEFMNKGVSTDALWNGIEPILNDAKSKLEMASTKLANQQINGIDNTSSKPIQSVKTNPIVEKGKTLLDRIKLLTTKSNDPRVAKWVSDQTAAVQNAISKNDMAALTILETETGEAEAEIAKHLKG